MRCGRQALSIRIDIGVQPAHTWAPLAQRGQSPSGPQRDLSGQAWGEDRWGGQARAGLPLSLRGGRKVDHQHQRAKACLFCPVQKVCPDFWITRRVELKPRLIPKVRREIFGRCGVHGAERVGDARGAALAAKWPSAPDQINAQICGHVSVQDRR